jgi:hypothetical protein
MLGLNPGLISPKFIPSILRRLKSLITFREMEEQFFYTKASFKKFSLSDKAKI